MWDRIQWLIICRYQDSFQNKPSCCPTIRPRWTYSNHKVGSVLIYGKYARTKAVNVYAMFMWWIGGGMNGTPKYVTQV